MPEINFEELASRLEKSFLPEQAAGINGAVQLEILAEEVEFWTLTIQDQTCQIARGKAESPRVSLRVSQQDLLALLNKELDPMAAFFTGKIHLQGEKSFLLKLPSLFAL